MDVNMGRALLQAQYPKLLEQAACQILWERAGGRPGGKVKIAFTDIRDALRDALGDQSVTEKRVEVCLRNLIKSSKIERTVHGRGNAVVSEYKVTDMTRKYATQASPGLPSIPVAESPAPSASEPQGVPSAGQSPALRDADPQDANPREKEEDTMNAASHTQPMSAASNPASPFGPLDKVAFYSLVMDMAMDAGATAEVRAELDESRETIDAARGVIEDQRMEIADLKRQMVEKEALVHGAEERLAAREGLNHDARRAIRAAERFLCTLLQMGHPDNPLSFAVDGVLKGAKVSKDNLAALRDGLEAVVEPRK